MFHTFLQLSELRFLLPRCGSKKQFLFLDLHGDCSGDSLQLPACGTQPFPPAPHPHVQPLQFRPPGAQGTGEDQGRGQQCLKPSPEPLTRAAALQRKPLGGTGISWSQTTSKILNLGLDEEAEPCKSWTVTQGPFPPSFKLRPPP